MNPIRIYSLNIEASKHLNKFPEHIRSFAPHVVFLQEVISSEAEDIARMLGMRLVQYVPMARALKFNEEYEWGLACYVSDSMHVASCESTVYAHTGEEIPVLDMVTGKCNRYLQKLTVVHENETITLLQTHFTWSPNGTVTSMQEEDFTVFRMLVSDVTEFALFGDLNAPREKNYLWGALAEKYTDNIPVSVHTTLDPTLHRAGHLPRVVDMCFTTHQYYVHTILLHKGISDHQGIFVELSRVSG